jgi:hypothetical protein
MSVPPFIVVDAVIFRSDPEDEPRGLRFTVFFVGAFCFRTLIALLLFLPRLTKAS